MTSSPNAASLDRSAAAAAPLQPTHAAGQGTEATPKATDSPYGKPADAAQTTNMKRRRGRPPGSLNRKTLDRLEQARATQARLCCLPLCVCALPFFNCRRRMRACMTSIQTIWVKSATI